MRETQTTPEALSVIGFDGQTLYQEPADPSRMAQFASDEDLVGRWLDGPYPCGLQISEPAIVAAACDTTVVTQFRSVEHALGGSGAPLMQFLDFVAFREIGPVLTLNIGGIANCQLADSDRRRMVAFDTGPGNVMLDYAARVLLGKPYDSEGAAAARGKWTRRCSRAFCSTTSFGARPGALGASTSARLSPTGTSRRTGTWRPGTCSPPSRSSQLFPLRNPFSTAFRS
jgi:1,6-anhydro-N-acetylmuramate kinase